MNQNLKALGLVAVMLGALMSAPHAADTSSTTSARKSIKPVGASPQIGFVHQVVSSGGVSANAFTFDVPAPKGAGNIVGCLLASYDVSGSLKRLNMSRTSGTVTVTGSNATSGTIATGDSVRGLCVYNP